VKAVFPQRTDLQSDIDFGKRTNTGGHTRNKMITDQIVFS
jgi:hypothetical protein